MKEVLVRNEEVTTVDPLLLAVPLSILKKHPQLSVHNKSSERTVVENDMKISFQHIFPTRHELNTTPNTSLQARKYMTRLLEKVMKKLEEDERNQLRDIHLLRFLLNYFDKNIVYEIAKSIMKNDITKLLPIVVMNIDMIKQSIDSSSYESDNDEL